MVKAKGFTLIELMIATALLSLVMFSGYYAYSLYSASWQKQTDKYWRLTNLGLKLSALDRMLQGTSPYIIKDINNSWSIFFNGDENFIQFITASPLFSASPALVELQVTEQTNGLKSLMYKESPLIKSPLINQGDVRQWQYQKIILKQIENIKFEYFGWENFAQAQFFFIESESVTQKQQRWYKKHQLEQRRLLPNQVRLHIKLKDQPANQLVFPLAQGSYFKLLNYLEEDE